MIETVMVLLEIIVKKTAVHINELFLSQKFLQIFLKLKETTNTKVYTVV